MEPNLSLEVIEQVELQSPRINKKPKKVTKTKKKATEKKAEPKKPAKKVEEASEMESTQLISARKKEPKGLKKLNLEPAKALKILEEPDNISTTEQEIILAESTGRLVTLINSLVSTLNDEIFDRYRQTSRLQMENDARLIAKLRDELNRKLQSIDALLAQISRLQSDLDADMSVVTASSSTPQKPTRPVFESPIRKQSSSLLIHQDELELELKTIGITLDMLELLTGVRIINYEEDTEKFYFDVKQASTNDDSHGVAVEYRLVIKKKFEQAADVNYVPVFLNDKDANVEKLVKHLPDYLRDNLIFPYNTLLQFYAKMSKALNKSSKS